MRGRECQISLTSSGVQAVRTMAYLSDFAAADDADSKDARHRWCCFTRGRGCRHSGGGNHRLNRMGHSGYVPAVAAAAASCQLSLQVALCVREMNSGRRAPRREHGGKFSKVDRTSDSHVNELARSS